MDIITLTTDFGTIDGYPAAMKGVIYNINPDVRVIDISHSIQPQNIHHGAYILYSVVDYFPKAIHIGVVDPGVGTDRLGLIFKCENGYFVGPDNGLLFPAAEKLGLKDVYKINNLDYCLPVITATFHGRDIFSPIAAQISKGIELDKLGEIFTDFSKLDLFKISQSPGNISGRILNIDKFGNIITNISKEVIQEHFDIDDNLFITIEPKSKLMRNRLGEIKRGIRIIPFRYTYADVPKGELVGIISSTGFLEIAGNKCNANNILKTQIADKIKVQK